MPATVKQVKQGRYEARAKNDVEPPMRRIRAAKDLLVLSGFTRDPSRLAKKIANLFITDGSVSEDVRAAAAKLLELVSSHAVNENEPENEDEVQMPEQFRIKRPKTRKASKEFQEAILNGTDFFLRYWEPPVGDGWPASDEDFKNAKTKARDILWPAVDQTRPRYCMEGGSFTTQRTEYGEEVLNEFYALVEKILAAPTEYKEPETAAPIVSPEPTYGIPMDTPYKEIRPRPELSVPPVIGPSQSLSAVRVTCRVCQSTDKGLATMPHDCAPWQNGEPNESV